ncbi:MAG: xylose isomerase, partial [Chloroflexota bacterium]
YHVAGNPGRNEPNASQELNYPAIYRSMSDTGYRGWVGLEYVPLEPPLSSMKAAVRQLRDATGS